MSTPVLPRGGSLFIALVFAAAVFAGLSPAAHAGWKVQRSWQVNGAYSLSVSPQGQVAILAAPASIYDSSVRVFNQQGRETSAFVAPGSSNEGAGISFDGGNIATVWGGGLEKVRITTTSPTGQPVSEVEPFGPEDQMADLDPFPGNLDIDQRGDRYLSVASNWSPAIHRFTADGTHLAWADGEGAGPGEFGVFAPVVTSSGNGDVYALDPANNRVQQFTDQGGFVRQWGQTGTGKGELWTPLAISVAPNGDVWVADDTDPRRVQRFSGSGRFIEEITLPDPQDDYGIIVGIDTDASGRLYVVTGKALYPGYVRVYSQTRKPAGGLRVLSKSLRLRKGKIAVRVRCVSKAKCRGILRIGKGKKAIGARRYVVKAGRKATMVVRPTARGRRLLAGAKRHRVIVTIRPAKGRAVKTRMTLRRS